MAMKLKWRWFAALGLPLLAAALLGAACPKKAAKVEAGAGKKGGPTVTGVSVESNQIEIKGSAKLDGYPFLSDPQHVAVDVKNASPAADLPQQVSGAGVITGVEVEAVPGMDPPVVRVIATVSQDVTYELKNRGSTLTLVLEPKEGAQEPAAETQAVPPAPLPYDETKKELESMLSGSTNQPMSSSQLYGGPQPTITGPVPVATLNPMPPPNSDGSANTLGDVLYRTMDDGVQILLRTNGPVGSFASYDLDNPPRLVVDLQGLSVGTSKRTYPMAFGGVNRIRVGKHPDMARVVVDFRGRLPAYSVKHTTDGISITVFKAGYMSGGVDFHEYTTGAGQSLRDVAQKVYGDPEAWVTIMAANRDHFKRSELESMRKSNGATVLGENMKLRIPER